MFAQFVATPVSLEIAARLAGNNSQVLNDIRESGEYSLDTGAKLIWIEEEQSFAIFSYHYNGDDGRVAFVDSLTVADMNMRLHLNYGMVIKGEWLDDVLDVLGGADLTYHHATPLKHQL